MIGFGTAETRFARGVSLLEGLVSLLILMVGVAGLAMAYQNTVYQSVSARNNSQAAQIAQSVLAELAASNPETWDVSVIDGSYAYTYEGDRIDPTDPSAYYGVQVKVVDQLGYYDVEIGVIWTGWRDEGERGGFANQSSDFAYVLNAMLSPQFTTSGGMP